MTTLELARLVARMRRAQRAYFRTRLHHNMEESKALEREVDQAVEACLDGLTSLFGPDESR